MRIDSWIYFLAQRGFVFPLEKLRKMGGVLLQFLGFSYLLLLLFLIGPPYVKVSSSDGDGPQSVTTYVGRDAIATTDENFVCATIDWWPPDKCDYGSCSWGNASILNLDVSNPILLNAVKAFAPLKLRLGGSLQNKVIYDVGEQPCTPFTETNSEMFGFSQGCLPMSRWDELNDFFKKAGVAIIFGLNALNGRVSMPDGSLGGSWGSRNAASLIRYSVNKGYTVHGWELGNELSGSGIGARIGADQYATDVINLKSIVNDIYEGFPVKPLVVAPGGFFDENWFGDFIERTKPDSVDVITHHIYNLGAGADSHLTDKILSPSYLDHGLSTFEKLQGVLKNSGTSATAWVGESGGAYNSGHNLVTNAFMFSFWYLDQLGMASEYDTKTYCRQTLIGGNYGLLNTTTFKPNPDYYSALLWHRLMGSKVLSTSLTGTDKIRAYGHCTKNSEGITLLLINLDSSTTFQVIVTTVSDDSKYQYSAPRASLSTVHPHQETGEFTRKEYHLTAKDGNLHSQTMLLNGNSLDVDSFGGDIPPLEPVETDDSQPITVAPYSIVFAQIPYFYAPACR